jgi:hypothetical protein
MTLSAFIRNNEQAILKDWEEFAHSHISPAKEMDSAELRDHLSSILRFITSDMGSIQTDSAQKEKSQGEGEKAGGAIDSAAETHADLRFFEAMIQGSDNKHSASASGSLGLGLFIVSEIVIAHGGEIDVVSTESAGTTFTVHLPRKSISH